MPITPGEAAVIAVGIGNIAAWAKLIYDARQRRALPAGGSPNGNGNGKSILGIEQDRRLTTAEAEIRSICREVGQLRDENRADHSRIFLKLDELGRKA